MVGPSLQYNGITINIANGTGGNPDFQKHAELREALDLAIDRDAINQVMFNGNATIGNQPVPPSSPFYAKDRPVRAERRSGARPRAGEAERGRASEARVDDDRMQRMRSSSARCCNRWPRMPASTSRCGRSSSRRQLSQQAQGNFQASLIGWSGRVDPDGNTYTLLGCKSPTNDARYCAGAEQYLLAGQSDTDRQKRHRGLSEGAHHHRGRPADHLSLPPAADHGLDGEAQGLRLHAGRADPAARRRLRAVTRALERASVTGYCSAEPM